MPAKRSRKKAEFRENVTFEIENQILRALSMIVGEKNFQHLNDVHWKNVALKINENETRRTLFDWNNLRHHFTSSLVYRCSEKKYDLKESVINKLIYPYLRKIYSVTLKFIRGNSSRSSNNTIQLEFQKLLIQYTMTGKYDEQIVKMFKKINPMRKRLTIEIDVDDPYFNLFEYKEILLQMDEREREKKTKRLIKYNNKLKITAQAELNQKDHNIDPDLLRPSDCDEFKPDQFDDLTIGAEAFLMNVNIPTFNHNDKDLNVAESSETPIESIPLIVSNNVDDSAIAQPVTNDNSANELVSEQGIVVADECLSESFFLDENTESTFSHISDVELKICRDLNIDVDIGSDDDEMVRKTKANRNLLQFLESKIRKPVMTTTSSVDCKDKDDIISVHPVTDCIAASEPKSDGIKDINASCLSDSCFLDENTESTDSEITDVEMMLCKDFNIDVDVQADDDKMSLKKRANSYLLRFLENIIQEKAKKPTAEILHQPEKNQFSEESSKKLNNTVMEKSVVAEQVHRTKSYNLITLDNCSSAIIISSDDDDDSEKNFFNPPLRIRRRPNPDMVPKLPKRKKLKFRHHNHMQLEISNDLPANMCVNVMSKCQAYIDEVLKFQQQSQLSSSPPSSLEDESEDCRLK